MMPAMLMEWIDKILDFTRKVGEFFVMMWNDEDRWWCIGGLIVFIIFFIKIFGAPIMSIISFLRGDGFGSSGHSTYSTNKSRSSSSTSHRKMKVTIKGVYQMNGPQPFSRIIEISPSESGYYSQLMGDKRKQAQWIQAQFPGADTARGFSMSINIK